MRRFPILICALLVAPSCTSTEVPARAPASEKATAARDTVALPVLPTVAAPRAPALVPVALAPRLALRAFALASRGRAPEARLLLARELAGAVSSPATLDETAQCDAHVAALEWFYLVRERECWTETAQLLERFPARSAATNPELAATLDELRAECLRALGRCDDARALTHALGTLTDWRILGPFDNERGKGFSVQQSPEKRIDFNETPKGKARELAWRTNVGAKHPLGRVLLGSMLRPAEQGLAYLATAVQSDVSREAVLHLASSGALKVFVNDNEVLARKTARPFFPDQDTVAIALAPGWNRIVLKSCVEAGPNWIVAARLTELDGRALVLSCDAAHAAEDAPQSTKPASKLLATTRERLDARAKDDAEAARLLTLYHLVVHPDDKAAKSARKAIDRAVAREPHDADTLYLAALAYAPEPGTSREELEANPWIEPLKEVVALDASHVAARLDLAEFSVDQNPLLARADQLSSAALVAVPADPRALEVRARVLHEIERGPEAELLERQLETNPEHAWTHAGVLARARRATVLGQRAAGLELLRAGFALARYEGEVLDELENELADLDQREELARVIDQVLDGAPYSLATLTRGAHRFELLGDQQRTRKLLERAFAIAPEDTDVLLALARADQREGNLDASDKRLAEILRIDPGQDKVRRQRELLAAKQEERFEAPYTWDARAVLAAAPPLSRDDPLCVLDRSTVIKVNRDGTSSSYEHILWRVQNDGGAKSLDVVGLPYPDGASLSVRSVRILHVDGTTDNAPAPRRGDQAGAEGYVRVYDLPPLAVGDAVELEYRSDESVPSVFGNYFGLRHEFYPDSPDPLAPTLRAELVLIHGPDVELYFAERNQDELTISDTQDARGRAVRRYVATDLARPKPESAMPRREELAPVVDVTTYANWQAFTTWWWSFIEKEFTTSPAMKAKVEELTHDLESEHDKIQALVRFVGQEIRYNSWPFGTHGYQPFSAPVIFERRFGDCKDKSILLCQMLSEIGVNAHPVLINAEYVRPNEPLDAAMVGQFNHCIAYAPATDQRPGMYLDCTADLDPLEYLRADDQGARVLQVDQGQASLHDIPYAPPEQNALLRRYEVTLDARGDGEVQLIDQSNGNFGVALRTNYGGEKGDIQKRLARDLRDSFAQVDIHAVETSELEDLGQPARLEARFSAKKLWSQESGGVSLRLAFDALGIERVAAESRGERQHELVLDRPFAHDVTIRYRLPAGAKLVALPPRVEVRAPGLVHYVQEVREAEGGIEVRRRFELEQRRIALAQYGDFQDALRQIELAEQRTLRLQTAANSEIPR